MHTKDFYIKLQSTTSSEHFTYQHRLSHPLRIPTQEAKISYRRARVENRRICYGSTLLETVIRLPWESFLVEGEKMCWSSDKIARYKTYQRLRWAVSVVSG